MKTMFILLSCIIMCTVGIRSAEGWWKTHTESVSPTPTPVSPWTSNKPDNVIVKRPNIAVTETASKYKKNQPYPQSNRGIIKRPVPPEDRIILPYPKLPYTVPSLLHLEKMPYYETIPYNSFIPHFAINDRNYH
jgi:hypothetical protein